MTFEEFMALDEMWFTDAKVTKRKPNKNYEGNTPPKSQAPQPATQVPGSKGFLASGTGPSPGGA